MSLKTFTYTKANNVTTQRVVQVLRAANKHDQAIDLSELSEEDQVLFALRYELLRQDFDAKLKELMQEFDVANNYRLFDPAKMADVVVEEVF